MKIVPRCSECEPGTAEEVMSGAPEATCAHCGLVWRRTLRWHEGAGIAKADYVYVAGDAEPTQPAGRA